MPTAITKHGLDARLIRDHTDLGPVWTISHAGRIYIYARKEDNPGEPWVGYQSIEAMREGKARTWVTAAKLETMMWMIAMFDVGEDMPDHRREIDEAVTAFEQGEVPASEREDLIDHIGDIVRDDPSVAEHGFAALAKVLAISFDMRVA
jgi:hypothetical protein